MFSALRVRQPLRTYDGLIVVRVGVALIILLHPLHGFFHPENLPDFGAYLSSLGYPFGEQLAWVVISVQALCSIALLVNRLVILACLGHIVIIIAGLIHVHYPRGWYVVGPGVGGMEWGFILLVCLLGVLCSYWPRRFGISTVVN